jgi:uncharacterized protein
MIIEFDPFKSEKNQIQRDLPFIRAIDLDWADAIIIPDTRFDYPEPRFVTVGYLDDRLHILCFTPIADGIRIISFRKANQREAKRYDKAINR